MDISGNPVIIECMRGSSKTLPKDPNQLAAEIVRISTEEEPRSIKEYLVEIGRKGGLKGGKARAKKLTAKRRRSIARKAAKQRWANKLKQKTKPTQSPK